MACPCCTTICGCRGIPNSLCVSFTGGDTPGVGDYMNGATATITYPTVFTDGITTFTGWYGTGDTNAPCSQAGQTHFAVWLVCYQSPFDVCSDFKLFVSWYTTIPPAHCCAQAASFPTSCTCNPFELDGLGIIGTARCAGGTVQATVTKCP